MLIAQAARQFHLWTGQHPPLDAMYEAALRKLKEREARAG
jgi:shikimate 5-dehydrogenase